MFLLFTSLVMVIDFAGIMLGEEINERNIIIFLNMLKIVMDKNRQLKHLAKTRSRKQVNRQKQYGGYLLHSTE